MAKDGAENGKTRKTIAFPVLCHYKIIAENDAGVERQIRQVLKDFGIQRPLRIGRRSTKGKYQAYNVEVVVNSKAFMEKLDAALREIPGVKWVL